MGGTIEYVWRDGARLTAWMLYVILVLDADLFRAFGVHVIVTSAIRTYAEQEAIFRARYVTAGNVNGRKVYDTRIWKGVRWYRISSAGTVAVPGSSNHEIQGTKAAVDIRDTGRDAGITVASSKRGKWIRKWCRDRGLLIASGDGFGEGWHFDVPNIFRIPPKPPTPAPTPKPVPEPEEEDDDMKMLGYKNPDDGRTWYAQFDTSSGFWSEFVSTDEKYIQSLAAKWTPDGIPLVSKSHRDDLKEECDRISGRTATA